jgi:phage tail-like protein
MFKRDPTGSFRFWVEIDGLLVAGFIEVSGLQSEVEVEEFREGGVNEYVHTLPRITKYPNIVLKRGVTSSDNLWSWYEKVTEGSISRKNGSIILLSQQGLELWRWNFFDAYPVKWVGPELKSSSSEVAVETLEITHKGLKGISNSIVGALSGYRL